MINYEVLCFVWLILYDILLAKKTPLEHAVSGGNLPAVRYLLDHGADLHMEGDENVTALHRAAKKGTTSYKFGEEIMALLHFNWLSSGSFSFFWRK